MSKWWTIGLVLALVASIGLMTGCENPFDDDDDDVATDSATIQGNVADFGLTTAAVAGVKAGVTVMIKGTDYKAVTADDGTFVISGVPAGNYVLVIKVGDQEVEYSLGEVAANSRVEITNIVVNALGEVSVETVKVVDLGASTTTTIVDNNDDDDDDDTSGTVNAAKVTIKIGRN